MQWNTYGEIDQLVAVFVFVFIEYFLTWLGKGLACVSDRNSLDESRSFSFIYMYDFSNVSEK